VKKVGRWMRVNSKVFLPWSSPGPKNESVFSQVYRPDSRKRAQMDRFWKKNQTKRLIEQGAMLCSLISAIFSNFRRKKLPFFSKTNAKIHFFAKTSGSSSKKNGENILKITTSVPGDRTRDLLILYLFPYHSFHSGSPWSRFFSLEHLYAGPVGKKSLSLI
jgi:hypothetical protein